VQEENILKTLLFGSTVFKTAKFKTFYFHKF